MVLWVNDKPADCSLNSKKTNMPIFTTSNVPILSLIEDIDMGKIGLP